MELVSDEAKYKPEELPVLIFSRRQDILDYLGYRHITGVKAWSSLAKTKYLAQLIGTLPEQNPQEQYKILAKIIGSRTDYVARMLTGLSIYDKIVENNFFGVKSLNEESIDFSVLTTALSYGNVPSFLGLESNKDREASNVDLEHLKEFTSWLFERNDQGKTRLGESRRLIQLNSVIGSPRALGAFRNGSPLVEAVLLTEAPNEIFRKAIQDSKSRLESARDSFHVVTLVIPGDSETLADISKLARNLRTLVEDKLLSEDDVD